MKNFVIIQKKSVRFLFSTFLILLVFNVLGILTRNIDNFTNIYQLFSFNLERNIPTLFSTLLLLLSSLLLFIIYRYCSNDNVLYQNHWKFLGIIFLLMALDENSMIHEKIMPPLRSYFHLSGFFYYSWVILGILFVFLIGLLYFRFLSNLDPSTRNGFILAGTLFVFGAVIIEMPEGYIDEKYGKTNILFEILYTIEESFEMIAIILFIKHLLLFIAKKETKLEIIFRKI